MRALALLSFVLMGITVGLSASLRSTEAPPTTAGITVLVGLIYLWLLASTGAKMVMLVTGEGCALVGGFALALLAIFIGAFMTTFALQGASASGATPSQGTLVAVVAVVTFSVWAAADILCFIWDAD